MPSLRHFCILLIIFAVRATNVPGQAKEKNVNFPSDDEIRLVLTQAASTLHRYKPLLNEEQEILEKLGKEGVEGSDRARAVLADIELAIKGLAKNPQIFNGPQGFVFIKSLDDASRNAALCSGSAQNAALRSVLAGDNAKAKSALQISGSCAEVSVLLHTVSENAGALYTKYIEGEWRLANDGQGILKQCTDILKQNGMTPRN